MLKVFTPFARPKPLAAAPTALAVSRQMPVPSISLEDAQAQLASAKALAATCDAEVARLEAARSTLPLNDEKKLNTHADAETRARVRSDIAARAVEETSDALARAEVAAADAGRRRRYDAAVAVRDALAEEQAKAMLHLHELLAPLQAKTLASNNEIAAVNCDRPEGAPSIDEAELYSRGTRAREAVEHAEEKALWVRDGFRAPFERQDMVRPNADDRTGTIGGMQAVAGVQATATLRRFRVTTTTKGSMVGPPRASLLDIDLPPVREPETAPAISTRFEMLDPVVPEAPRFQTHDRASAASAA